MLESKKSTKSQLADDTIYKIIKNVFDLLEKFTSCSGLTVIKIKTKVLTLNPVDYCDKS